MLKSYILIKRSSMKSTSYLKILIILFSSVSIGSTSAMQYALDVKDLLLTKEAGTIISTAVTYGCCSISFLTLCSRDMRRGKNVIDSSLTIRRGLQLALQNVVLQGIPLGIARVFAEGYGSWPHIDSDKPFFVASSAASVLSLYQSFLNKKDDNNNSNGGANTAPRSKLTTTMLINMGRWFPYCVLGASLWTAAQRYRIVQS
jgi:hypothetical protein